MAYLVVDQRVQDVRRWAEAFAEGAERRRAAGGEVVLTLADPVDIGRVLVIVRFETAQQARAWRSRPGVAQEVARGGVIAESVSVRMLDEMVVS
ncbi:hypothetical protein F3087_19120 [Nocardia colli]|uniref:ABM domain-containing protein n=1 Tax=Nocardia colli TaxID=2545717 RepID=A0A5N0EC73_9NOCA|nr:hypothetical protein [Nocardia colli]KAA8887032.1 hypothetical protein F3087_19120 [Nocardia colli]